MLKVTLTLETPIPPQKRADGSVVEPPTADYISAIAEEVEDWILMLLAERADFWNIKLSISEDTSGRRKPVRKRN